MRRRARFAIVLVVAAAACATAPRIEVRAGAGRQFGLEDRFAPASLEGLEIENPDVPETTVEILRETLERSIGWRGLRTAPPADADWLVSCSLRKRLIWKNDITRDPVTQIWSPTIRAPEDRRPRSVGASGTEYHTRGALQPASNAPAEPWVDTIVLLELRSQRTGTIGWSAARLWGRDRKELPEDELRQTFDLLLGRLELSAPPPASPQK